MISWCDHILIRTAVTVLVLCVALSCSDDTAVMAELDRAEAVMEEYPDSALALLDSLDRSRLTTREAKARHSLLYSQALDKNYIDLSTDSIINPAVKYYSRHGSPDDRLKTQYYLGCIFRNAGDRERAMEHFVEAERYVDRATDWQAVGRLYSAKRTIYADIYDFEKSYRDALLSAEYYGKAGDLRLQIKALTCTADYAYILKDYEVADSLLNDIKESYWDEMDNLSKSYYYSSAINLARHSDIDATKKLVNEYIRTISTPEDIDWGVVANAYRLAEDTDSALWALERYPLGFPDYETEPQYLLLCSLIYEDLGQYDKAYSSLKKYSDIVGDEDIEKFEADTKFIEERYAHENAVTRHRNTIILIVSGTVTALLLAALIISSLRGRIKIARLRAEQERLEAERKLQYLENFNKKLLQEKDTLTEMLSNSSLSDNHRQSEDGATRRKPKPLRAERNALVCGCASTVHRCPERARTLRLGDRLLLPLRHGTPGKGHREPDGRQPLPPQQGLRHPSQTRADRARHHPRTLAPEVRQGDRKRRSTYRHVKPFPGHDIFHFYNTLIFNYLKFTR